MRARRAASSPVTVDSVSSSLSSLRRARAKSSSKWSPLRSASMLSRSALIDSPARSASIVPPISRPPLCRMYALGPLCGERANRRPYVEPSLNRMFAARSLIIRVSTSRAPSWPSMPAGAGYAIATMTCWSSFGCLTPTNTGPVRLNGVGSTGLSGALLFQPPNVLRTIDSAYFISNLPTTIRLALPAVKWLWRNESSASLCALLTASGVAIALRVYA
jgi:hypothetical protein